MATNVNFRELIDQAAESGEVSKFYTQPPVVYPNGKDYLPLQEAFILPYQKGEALKASRIAATACAVSLVAIIIFMKCHAISAAGYVLLGACATLSGAYAVRKQLKGNPVDSLVNGANHYEFLQAVLQIQKKRVQEAEKKGKNKVELTAEEEAEAIKRAREAKAQQKFGGNVPTDVNFSNSPYG